MPHVSYIGSDGTVWPSVTEVLKCANKQWLWDWYRRSVMKSGKKGWIANETKAKEGAELGTAVHGEIENILRGGDSKSPHAAAAVTALAAYSKEIEAVETHLVDSQLKIHGTLDFVCRLPDGRLCVGDWKTSLSEDIYHKVQLSAYDYMFGGSGTGLLVMIDKRSKVVSAAKVKVVEELPKYFEVFKALLVVWNYEHGRI